MQLDHGYAIPTTVPGIKEHTNINPKYADDITYITTDETLYDTREAVTTERLKKYNLLINQTKTEKYIIPEPKRPKPPIPPVPRGPDGKRSHGLNWIGSCDPSLHLNTT